MEASTQCRSPSILMKRQSSSAPNPVIVPQMSSGVQLVISSIR
ncbi:hypothetical protein N9Q24_02510 [Flavobacteriaceae bacterium]|nr:hypothetical protein [Flavobacteriaceae bacterium]MDA9310240.1 hypothetical protein [Flavobacteriaceae bacterium]MDC0097494.1 hypothetical protein [Flavobacteriaceae bacterium]MDC1372713.1 hypothetical protein [Flavobacteriaceae bacterium]